jgi:hypothetical protein
MARRAVKGVAGHRATSARLTATITAVGADTRDNFSAAWLISVINAFAEKRGPNGVVRNPQLTGDLWWNAGCGGGAV